LAFLPDDSTDVFGIAERAAERLIEGAKGTPQALKRDQF
jgi:hypothetical protein